MTLSLRGSFCLCLLMTLAGPVYGASDTSAQGGVSVFLVQPDSADANRLLPVEGALNVRDLGGLTGDHGAVPYDHFIRAANLSKLTPADRDILYKHGVVLDIDLRTPGEDQTSPDALASDPHIRYLPISLFGDKISMPAKMPTLREMYISALADNQSQFKQIFEAIAATDQGGVLYHCTAGKDRTGMISAMLLELSGVPRDKIVHNYAVSAYYLQPMYSVAMISKLRTTQPAMAALLGSPPDAIEGFLDTLDSRYGGSAAYLQMIGVSASDVAKIRHRLSS